jgi:hypothetical protein
MNPLNLFSNALFILSLSEAFVSMTSQNVPPQLEYEASSSSPALTSLVRQTATTTRGFRPPPLLEEEDSEFDDGT